MLLKSNPHKVDLSVGKPLTVLEMLHHQSLPSATTNSQHKVIWMCLLFRLGLYHSAVRCRESPLELI